MFISKYKLSLLPPLCQLFNWTGKVIGKLPTSLMIIQLTENVTG